MTDYRKPYISIVVPIYGVEEYLFQCFNSLINQDIDMDDYEILLIDDGSKDKCPVMIDEYAKEYSNVFAFHKKNGGLSDARNYGAMNACGKYILFVDADDFIQENALKGLIDCCKKQGEPDVFFVGVNKVYENKTYELYDETMDLSWLSKGRKEVLIYLSKRVIFPTSAWSKMIKRRVLVDNNITFKKGQLSEDYEWSVSVYMASCTFGAYDDILYYYRQNRCGSITSHVREKHFSDLINIIDNILNNVAATKEEDILKKSAAAYVYKVLLINSYEYYDKYKKRIRDYKYLLKYRQDREIKIMRVFADLFGIKNLVRALHFYQKIRNN